MDIQETAKRLMEGAEQMAKSVATKPKFTHSVPKGGKHKDSEGLEGSTEGVPPTGDEEEDFSSNVSSKEAQRPTDEKMPGKKAGRLRKKDSMTDVDSEVQAEVDYLADNPGKKAASGIGKVTKLTREEVEELHEQGDEPFTDSELREIEQATKKMADMITDARKNPYSAYTHFNFKKLEKYVNPKAGEVEYAMENRNGSAQFLWNRERGKITLDFSVEIGDTGMSGFPTFVGRNITEIVNKFVKTMKDAGVKEEISMDHHLEALFNGQELSEDFKSRTATIFEAAVNERVESIREQLETKVEAKLAAAIEENKEEMAANLDSYLNYVVEEWMKENEVAIERGLRNEVTEEFLGGLRNLFIEHNIDVPESKVDVLEKMAERIEELEESLNKEIENNISLREKVENATKRDVVEEIGSDLTASERVKLRKLLEGVNADSHTDFITKAKILKENYFAEGIEPIRNTEEGIEDLQPNYLSESNDTMSEYLKALNRMGRK